MAENEEVSTPTETKSEPALEDLLREALSADTTPDPKAAVATAVPAPETASGNTDEVKTQPAQQAPDSKEPPEHWSESDKTTFKTLAPDAQEYLLRRDREMTADYTEKTTKLADARKFHDELDPIFKSFDPLLRAHGISPAQAVQTLLNAQAALDQNPAETLKKLADMYKVDLKSLQPSEDKFVDPEVAALKKELDELKGQLNQTVQTTKVSQESQARGVIEQFKNERDASGNPKYPYFDRVANEMANIIGIAKQSGKTVDLPTAYEKAIRLDDELFGKTIKDREAAALKARDEEVKRQTAAAKTKQDGNIKGKNTPSTPSKPVTIEDNLRAAFSQ